MFQIDSPFSAASFSWSSPTTNLSKRNCESPNPTSTLAERLNARLVSSGPGYTLNLCPGTKYIITSPLRFAAPNQEISTAGHPTGSTRATLVVGGVGQTTAVDGTCANCDGVKLRNVQIDGARRGVPPKPGGANIEMGGPNANQLIENVRSFDPRGWSCLHVAQGNLDCTNVTIQNNDIGPAGSHDFQQWADGISVACRNSLVKGNRINNPTDGGVVLFGSPGTRVEDNTIWVETQTLLGGINLVDVEPFGGNYDGVVVTNNTIIGGFASQSARGSETKGSNIHNAFVKVGIAIGPSIWFGDRYHDNVNFGGTVQHNRLTGAFGYGIAMSSVTDFTVENNTLVDNTTFVGARGPNCTMKSIPAPAPFVLDPSNVHRSTTQRNFKSIADGSDLVTCVVPPAGGAQWPFGKIGNGTVPAKLVSRMRPRHLAFRTLASAHDHGADTGAVVLVLLIVAIIASWFVLEWAARWHTSRQKLWSGRASRCNRSVEDVERA